MSFILLSMQDPAFYMLKEDETPCIFGSIDKQRWSYACAKQLIERLIYGTIAFFSYCLVDFDVGILKRQALNSCRNGIRTEVLFLLYNFLLFAFKIMRQC